MQTLAETRGKARTALRLAAELTALILKKSLAELQRGIERVFTARGTSMSTIVNAGWVDDNRGWVDGSQGWVDGKRGWVD